MPPPTATRSGGISGSPCYEHTLRSFSGNADIAFPPYSLKAPQVWST